MLAMVGALAQVAACGSDEPGAAEVREPLPAFRHAAFYEELQTDADALSFRDGDWLEDQGDAPFYGLAFYGRTTAGGGNAARADRAEKARARALDLLVHADFVTGDVNELAMSALGLVDDIAARGERDERTKDDRKKLDAFLDRLTGMVRSVGWYIDDRVVQSWAIDMYGPTSISALLGLIPLQEAIVLGGDRAADRVAWSVEMEQQIDAKAWTGDHWAFGGGRDLYDLYPNVAMMLLETRLFQLTGEARYRERALATYRAIQPLRLSTDPTRYYSPYSAGSMGAKTRDYSTLSSHNYLMLSLLGLYEITGDAMYVREADSVVDAISSGLKGQWCLSDMHHEACAPACGEAEPCVASVCEADACHPGVLHHWMDGRIALPTDTEFFCGGCNLQLLYVLWYRQHGLRAPG